MTQSFRPLTPGAFQSFGELLGYLRKRAHLSQRELALSVGYHYSHLSRLEKNQHTPDAGTVRALFIPALGLQHEPEWAMRLIELTQTREGQSRVFRPPVSSGNIQGLPLQLTSILGREQEIAAIEKLLSNSAVRILTLVGPPGVGKTRLAICAAERVAAQFANGVAFVDLTTTKQPDDVLPMMAGSVGIEEVVEQTVLKNLIHLLQTKNMLIVMDNFEQVVQASPQVAIILAQAPNIKILTTSREALRIDGEFEFVVRPLPLPTASFQDYASIQLFVERARSIKPDFELTDENASRVAEICHRLDGLPLAIELAAARINNLSLTAMLEQFERRFDWLTRGRNDSPTWRKTLSGAIEWSYQLLSESERTLMQRLSTFEGGWTLEAAEAVCSDDTLCPSFKVFNLLLGLADRSLLVTETNEQQTRYHFLLTIHHFAQKHLERSGELEASRARHLSYFSEWSEKIAAKLDSLHPRELRQVMEKEHNNLRSAFEWAQDKRANREHGLRLVIAVSTIWLKLSHFKQALDWVNITLSASEELACLFYRAKLLYLKSALAYWRDDFIPALECNIEAERLACQFDDKKLLADILYYRGGCIYREMGRYPEAYACLEESIAICRAEKHLSRLSIALTGFSLVLFHLEQEKESQAAIQEALQVTSMRQDVWGQSYALRTQADILRFKGNYIQALDGFKQALQTSLSIEDRISAGMALSNMALICNLLESYSVAAEYARSSFEIFNEIGNEYQQPFPLRMMGYAALHMGDLAQAREMCKASLIGNRDINHQTGILACIALFAEIEYSVGNLQNALTLYFYVHQQLSLKKLYLMEPDQRVMKRLGAKLKDTSEFKLAVAILDSSQIDPLLGI